MAGPFGNPNSAAELSVQAPSPQAALPTIDAPQAPSTIADIANVVNAVAPSVNAAMGQYYEGQVKQQLQSVEAALAATKYPWLQDALLASEASKDPIVLGAISEMKSISAAQRKGRLPPEYAMDRMEQIVSSAVAKVPAYETELTQAARKYLGFDPHQQQLQTLMQPSPEDKAFNEIKSQAANLGISVHEAQQFNLLRAQLEIQKQQADLQAAVHSSQRSAITDARGDIEFSQKQEDRAAEKKSAYDKTTATLNYNSVLLEMASISSDYGTIMQTAMASGKGIPDIEKVIVSADDKYNELRKKLITNAPPGQDITAQLNEVDKQRDGMRIMLTAVSEGKVLKSQNDYIKSAAQHSLLVMPKLGSMYAAFGPDSLPAITSTLARLNNNPGGKEAWLASGDPNAGAYLLGAYIDGVGRVKDSDVEGGFTSYYKGTAPANDEQRKVAILLGMQVATDPNTKPADAAEAVTKLGNIASPTEFYASMSSSQMVAANVRRKEVWGQLVQQQTVGDASIKRRIATLVQQGIIDPAGISVDKDGVVRFTANVYNPVSNIAEKLPESLSATSEIPSVNLADRIGKGVDTVENVGKAAYNIVSGLPTVASSSGLLNVGVQTASRNITLSNLESDINKFLYYSDAYSKVGIVPSSNYTDRARFVSELNQTAQDAYKSTDGRQVGTQVNPIKYQMVNGKLVRAE